MFDRAGTHFSRECPECGDHPVTDCPACGLKGESVAVAGFWLSTDEMENLENLLDICFQAGWGVPQEGSDRAVLEAAVARWVVRSRG